MNRLVPLALVSMMMLSAPVAQAGGTHGEVAHGAVVHPVAPHAASGRSDHSSHRALRAAADFAGAFQDLGTTDDEGDADASEAEDAPPDPATAAAAVRVAELYYGYVPGRPAPPAQLSTPVTAPAPQHHPLDPVLALAALHAVDVSTCSEKGPSGYGHARVTFGADGHAAGLLLAAPPGLSREAAECIQARFDAVSVAPFEGSPVTVGTSFYVK